MTEAELEEYESIECEYNKYWIPIRWAYNIITKARQEKRIVSDYLYDRLYQVRL
jgi:hypothetical protein